MVRKARIGLTRRVAAFSSTYESAERLRGGGIAMRPPMAASRQRTNPLSREGAGGAVGRVGSAAVTI